MATCVIGSARSDENGKYVNGAAGDQKQKSSTNDTSGEVSMQNFYVHSKGWYIIRPKTVELANKLAERMKAACNNANIGYDQNDRLGIIKYGIDTKTKTECDCSSLVRQCVIEASGKDPGNFTTDGEASALAKTGLFEDKVKYVSQSKTPTKNGDILVTCSKGHTVIQVSGRARSSSSSSSSGSTSSGSTSSGSTTSSLPTYKTGTNYTLQVDKLAVRTGAGTNCTRKTYKQLTANAQKHAYSDGYLKKGTTVTCKGSKTVSGNVWIQIPSGWIAAYYNGKYYVK